MYLSINLFNIDINNIYLSSPKENIYNRNGKFLKLYYKNNFYIFDNLIFDIQLDYNKKNIKNNKIIYNIENNKNNTNEKVFEQIKNIENNLFSKINTQNKFNKYTYISDILKNKKNYISKNEKINNENSKDNKKIYLDFSQVINIKIIINGIWIDENSNCGFSYKII